ncbi:MAG: hypothetical protein IPL26_13130 [Leptospiraceae bacterium]|nr:hypothetical protein [Leptospiraceae bacterium]
MKVRITWSNPVLMNLHLYILGVKFDLQIVDTTKNIFIVNDDKGVAFGTYSEAESYCNNQDYKIEANNDNP